MEISLSVKTVETWRPQSVATQSLDSHVMPSPIKGESNPWLKAKDSGHLIKDGKSWKQPSKDWYTK